MGGIIIATAVCAIPVFLSGEEAEETVEHIAGISENLIEEHEEIAEKAIWAIEILGLLAILALFAIIKNAYFEKALIIITLLTAIATFGFFIKVGSSGGHIRHSEIRPDITNAEMQNNATFKAEEEEDD